MGDVVGFKKLWRKRCILGEYGECAGIRVHLAEYCEALLAQQGLTMVIDMALAPARKTNISHLFLQIGIFHAHIMKLCTAV